jgi:hypothetical protein
MLHRGSPFGVFVRRAGFSPPGAIGCTPRKGGCTMQTTPDPDAKLIQQYQDLFRSISWADDPPAEIPKDLQAALETAAVACPKHHIYPNNGTLWLRVTVLIQGRIQLRVAVSLRSADEGDARKKRDALIIRYSAVDGVEVRLRFRNGN